MKVVLYSLVAILVFIVSIFVIPLLGFASAGSSESFVLSTCAAVVFLLIAERLVDHQEIIGPVEAMMKRFESLADEHIRLTQSASFSLFFERARNTSTSGTVKPLEGYWVAIRRDAKKGKICVYLHEVYCEQNEVRFSSFDENSPGERYFVDGVVLSVANQAIMYGKVRGRDSLHIYALFAPAGVHPPYVFGTHFQTTLSGSSSIATPVVFLRVDPSVLTQRDQSVRLEFSDFLEKNSALAKRHEDNALSAVLNHIDDICTLRADQISIGNIVNFLREGRSSIEIEASMMEKHLDSRCEGRSIQ